MTELPFNDEIEERLGYRLHNFGYDKVRELMVEYAEGRLAAHTEKLLADVEMPEPDAHFHLHQYGENTLLREQVSPEYKDEEGVFPLFTADQLQQYAAAAAAQARVKALEEAAVEFEGLYSLGGDDIAKCLRQMKEQP